MKYISSTYLNNGIPTYEDLKLSYVYTDKKHKNYNLNVLDSMFKNNDITEEDYKLAIAIINEIKREIKSGKNFIFNDDYVKYLSNLGGNNADRNK